MTVIFHSMKSQNIIAKIIAGSVRERSVIHLVILIGCSVANVMDSSEMKNVLLLIRQKLHDQTVKVSVKNIKDVMFVISFTNLHLSIKMVVVLDIALFVNLKK